MPPAPRASKPSMARAIHHRSGSQTSTTPIKGSPLARSSTPPKTTVTPQPPSRTATPASRNSAIITNSPGKALPLTDSAPDLNGDIEKRLVQMETTFERGADQLLQRMEQMTSCVDTLERMIQDLLKDDFDEHREPEQESDENPESDPSTPVAAPGPSLMDEESPFL